MLPIQTPSSTELLKFRNALALEMIGVEPILRATQRLLPGIMRNFSAVPRLRDLPEYKTLSSDGRKFIKLMEKWTYVQIRDVRAFRPEGMSSTYLQFLATLLPVTEQVKGILIDVVQPYSQFLAQLVANRDARLSTDDATQEYRALEARRESIYEQFAAHYRAGSYATNAKVGDVVERQDDWVKVLATLEQCERNMKEVNRDKLDNLVQQCSRSLELLYQQLQKGAIDQASHEAAKRLSNGAYQVAKELELFSTTYYRVLALRGSVSDTVDFLTDKLD